MSERDPNHVIIFDTTLRDGEQSPGISLDEGEKLEIAEQLARLGVDVIEAGFPIASQGDFEAHQGRRRAVGKPGGPVICGLSRTAHKDVDRCWEAIEGAAERRIHIFIATSETHMKHKLRMTPEQVIAEASSVGRQGPHLHRRRRVLTRGRVPLRLRLHVHGAAGSRRRRRHHAEHPRHRRLRHPRGVRPPPRRRPRPRARRLRHLGALPRRPRAGGRQLAGRDHATAPARSSARSTASASGPATPRWRRS